MADINNSVSQVVEDLKKKIDELNILGEDADVANLAKINDIKQKAIKVLLQVSNKIVDTAKNITDEDELNKSIEIVKVRSKELYDNAVCKINEIISAPIIEETSDIVDDVRSDIDKFFEQEEIKNAANDVKEASEKIADKAVSALKEWLKPEGK